MGSAMAGDAMDSGLSDALLVFGLRLALGLPLGGVGRREVLLFEWEYCLDWVTA